MRQRDLPSRVPTGSARIVIAASLRVLGSAIALIGFFYVWPLGRDQLVPPVALFLIALVGLSVVFGLQVRAIIRSPQPGIRAIEALAASIPLLLVTFASAYFAMSEASSDTFTEPLSKTGALYFAVTVFSTVGFGDITPTTDAARLVVSVQMIFDLLFLGVGLHILTGAVRIGRERRAAVDGTPRGGPSAPQAPEAGP